MINEAAMTPLLSKRSVVSLAKNFAEKFNLKNIQVFSVKKNNGMKSKHLITTI